MPRALSAVRLLVMTSLALLGLGCGSSSEPGACGNPDSSSACANICSDLDAYRRLTCVKPPYQMCGGNGAAAKPLDRNERDYVIQRCRDCSGCSQGCQSCSTGLPPF